MELCPRMAASVARSIPASAIRVATGWRKSYKTSVEELAAECSYRPSLVVHYVEHHAQLRNLQQVVNLLGEVRQLQLAALVPHRGKGADQLADARAVDVVDVAQIEEDFLLSLAEQVFDGVAQNRAAFAQFDLSTQVNNRDVITCRVLAFMLT